MTRRNARPFIALVAAYALALQAVLAGLTLGTRSGHAGLLAANELCVTSQQSQDQQPAERMPCCSLAACCPSADTPGLPSAAPAIAVSDTQTAVFDASISAAPHPVRLGLAQPRAPPRA